MLLTLKTRSDQSIQGGFQAPQFITTHLVAHTREIMVSLAAALHSDRHPTKRTDVKCGN